MVKLVPTLQAFSFSDAYKHFQLSIYSILTAPIVLNEKEKANRLFTAATRYIHMYVFICANRICLKMGLALVRPHRGREQAAWTNI